jgi:hypothetical protein
LSLQRKLNPHGTSGIAFASDHLTAEEASGSFEFLGHGGWRRDARLVRLVSASVTLTS